MKSTKLLTLSFFVVIALVIACCGTCIPWGGLRKKNDAFHEAALDGDIATVRRFLDQGKHPDALGLDPTDGKGGALLGALYMGHFDVADLLDSRGADVNLKHHGRSLLYWMVDENKMAAYVWLLRHKAKPDPGAETLLKQLRGKGFRD